MPKSCCVPGCNSNKKKNQDLQFYIIPSDRSRRERWLQAISRAKLNPDGSINKNKRWSPRSGHCYVCSTHFITGLKVNDSTHPDYVPSIFPSTSSRADDGTEMSIVKINRFQRAAKRSSSTVKLAEPCQARKKLKLVDENSQLDKPYCTLSDDTLGEESQHQETKSPEVPQLMPMKQPLEKSEREMMYVEMENLRKERDNALQKISGLESIICAASLSSASVEGNDDACQNMTGISWEVFLPLYTYLSTCITSKWSNKASLPLREQLFLTLVKLRHNVSFDLLAHIKGIPKSTTIDYFWKWIDLMHGKIGFMITEIDRETIFSTIPPVFKAKFPRLTSIIDCFEIFIEAPKNLLARAQCYSSYKKHCTVKVFISCTPIGSINYISNAWGGRASDIKIVRESGFISPKYIMPGDQILGDRGFTLREDFAMYGAQLLTPSFTKGKKQLAASDVEISRKISSVRIHIERVIGLMKNRFTILKGTLPIRCIKSIKDESSGSVLSSCDKIIKVCAALTNLGTGIVYKE